MEGILFLLNKFITQRNRVFISPILFEIRFALNLNKREFAFGIFSISQVSKNRKRKGYSEIKKGWSDLVKNILPPSYISNGCYNSTKLNRCSWPYKYANVVVVGRFN